MAKRPLRPCAHRGCPNLVITGYCDEHKKANSKRKDKGRLSGTERGYDSKWRKVRDIKIKRNPLCEVCLKQDILTPATLVHHITPLSRGGKRLDLDNLQSLCRACHFKIHDELGDEF